MCISYVTCYSVFEKFILQDFSPSIGSYGMLHILTTWQMRFQVHIIQILYVNQMAPC